MPFPLLAAAVPYLASAAAGAAGGYLGKRLSRGLSQSLPTNRGGGVQQMNGYSSMEMPGGATAVQMPNFTPEQQSMLTQMLQGGMQGMQNLPSADFGPIEQMYKTQFQQETVPGLAEQFTAGGAGSQRSSAFQQALGGAGAGLAERLAGMRQQFNMQNRQNELQRLMGMLQMGMQPQYQYGIVPPGEGFGTSLAGRVGQGIGTIAPMMIAKLLGM